MSDLNHLNSMQRYVTQEGGTEPPFQNDYWDLKSSGIYVDIISKIPLFSSKDKFDSGTGWPSFTQPISSDVVTEHMDISAGMTRIEVKSASSGSHLGHVFDDGPAPTGRRYCINSAALEFIPSDQFPNEDQLS